MAEKGKISRLNLLRMIKRFKGEEETEQLSKQVSKISLEKVKKYLPEMSDKYGGLCFYSFENRHYQLLDKNTQLGYLSKDLAYDKQSKRLHLIGNPEHIYQLEINFVGTAQQLDFFSIFDLTDQNSSMVSVPSTRNNNAVVLLHNGLFFWDRYNQKYLEGLQVREKRDLRSIKY